MSRIQRPSRHGRVHVGSMNLSICLFVVLVFCILPCCSGGFIDKDTPLDKRTTTSLVDGSIYHLVMSDEFNAPDRTFTDGHDPVWTALDKPDDDSSSAGGGSQQFYNSSFVTTENGMLKISTKIGKTSWKRYDPVKKLWKIEQTHFKSGMVQSWEKFCFTGGIVEIDVILPGDPFIGGLWPAIWMLGNLGRATYEGSTNNIWPWSFDTCDRTLQPAQTISACNSENHFGMHPFQGRGATEIDIIEIMTGDSKGPLPATDPPISLPYADMTLQVAPGVPKNRPQPGAAPIVENKMSGHVELLASTWYDGLELHGNTSINPFFYGTYLGVTKPGEPVTRTKKQAFQADAIGAAHQLTPEHFNKTHTFRVEWQPGTGGRIDWFTKGPENQYNKRHDDKERDFDWVHTYGIKDDNLKQTMGSQIPIEPTSLIFNTAVSSTWGFPYVVPDNCQKCYDCDDPKCACSLGPGFCKMLRDSDVAMFIDSVRVYQSRDPTAHVGAAHSLGCDPPDYPTRGWIKGHEFLYMRNAPFSYNDKEPLRNIQRGGGSCESDDDCGANLPTDNFTALYEAQQNPEIVWNQTLSSDIRGHGRCVDSASFGGMFSSMGPIQSVCSCYPGYTGPRCLAQDHVDDTESAYVNTMNQNIFIAVPSLYPSPFLIGMITVLFVQAIFTSVYVTKQRKKALTESQATSKSRKPVVVRTSYQQEFA